LKIELGVAMFKVVHVLLSLSLLTAMGMSNAAWSAEAAKGGATGKGYTWAEVAWLNGLIFRATGRAAV
jgi:hypothetical protein